MSIDGILTTWLGTTGWAPEVIIPRRRIRFSSQLSLSTTRVSCIAIATPAVNTFSISIQIRPHKQFFEIRSFNPDRNDRKPYTKGADKYTATITRDVWITAPAAPHTGHDYIFYIYHGP